MALSHTSGPLVSSIGLGVGGDPGTAGAYSSLLKTVTGILDSTATTVLTINVPNSAQSAVIFISFVAGITNAGHTYDSTRVVSYQVAITRVPNAATVVNVSAAIGGQIATSSGGQTFTLAFAAGSVTGANTATQTIPLQITNVNASAGTTETQIYAETINRQGFAPIGTQSGPATGVTIS
jgi:hypothetical protein